LDGERRQNAENGADGSVEPWYAAEVGDKDAGIIDVVRPHKIKDQGKDDKERYQFFEQVHDD
jgi:hypothetical protein